VKTILVDHDIEGQVLILWGILSTEGWLELYPLELVTFAQAQGMILLTHNRNINDADSLEHTIREAPPRHRYLSLLWEELIVSEKVPIASVALSA
jgi:hypothetical protein